MVEIYHPIPQHFAKENLLTQLLLYLLLRADPGSLHILGRKVMIIQIGRQLQISLEQSFTIRLSLLKQNISEGLQLIME